MYIILKQRELVIRLKAGFDKMKSIYLTVVILLLSASLFADKTGTMAAKFLSTNIGSQAVGMGGAFTSIANDGSAMFWNPAGISFNQLRKFYVNHSNWIADISFDYFSLSIPINENNYIGLNVTSVTMGEMEVTRYGNEKYWRNLLSVGPRIWNNLFHQFN